MREYALSNEMGSSLVVAPLITIPTILVLSAAYGAVGFVNPLPYLTIVLLFVFIALTGWLLNKTMLASKCRNTKFASGLGLVLALLFIHSAWSAFLGSFLWKLSPPGAEVAPLSLFTLFFFDPALVWSTAMELLDEGWFTIFGAQPSGLVLACFWLIEAAIMGLGIWGATGNSLHEEVFCETCNAWTTLKQDDRRCVIPDSVPELERVQKGDMDAIAGLQLLPEMGSEDAVPHFRFNLHECSTCRRTRTLDIDVVKYEEAKGKVTENVEDFSSVFVMDESDYDKYTAQAEVAAPPSGAS